MKNTVALQGIRFWKVEDGYMLTTKVACVTAFRNYIGVPALSGFSDLDTTPNPTGYIPMLATGVKDENGQMVFERDVVYSMQRNTPMEKLGDYYYAM